MIGKIIKGTSFSGCIAYCLSDKLDYSEDKRREMSQADRLNHVNRAEILDYNLCFGNQKELAEQFRQVAKLSRKVEKPVFHLTLRAAPGDELSREKWIDIGRAAAKEFGFSDHQFLNILHKDTPQPHIHIVANRVGYDGKSAGDSNSYARMAALCRLLELEHDLKKVLSPRRYLSPKDRQIPRQDARKANLRQEISSALKESANYSAFEKRMKKAGYTVIKGRGIAFEDGQKVRIKGSEVGFSLQTVHRILQRQDLHMRVQQKQELERRAGKSTSETFRPGGSDSDDARGRDSLLTKLLRPEYSSEEIKTPWELTNEGQKHQKRQIPKPRL